MNPHNKVTLSAEEFSALKQQLETAERLNDYSQITINITGRRGSPAEKEVEWCSCECKVLSCFLSCCSRDTHNFRFKKY